MLSIYEWIEERVELQSIADDILAKYVPAHVNIFYCFGGLVLTSFLVQGATGFALTIYYRPTVIEAFYSLKYLVSSISFGWLIRSIHRWSSGIMVLALILHIYRVYLTGGFKKPREVTWVSGVLLSLVTLSFGVTGYSLPWDQIGYWACKIFTSVPESFNIILPGLGDVVVIALRGGTTVGQLTLTRLYSLHTFLLPVLGVVLMLVHFILLRKQGISGPL